MNTSSSSNKEYKEISLLKLDSSDTSLIISLIYQPNFVIYNNSIFGDINKILFLKFTIQSNVSNIQIRIKFVCTTQDIIKIIGFMKGLDNPELNTLSIYKEYNKNTKYIKIYKNNGFVIELFSNIDYVYGSKTFHATNYESTVIISILEQYINNIINSSITVLNKYDNQVNTISQYSNYKNDSVNQSDTTNNNLAVDIFKNNLNKQNIKNDKDVNNFLLPVPNSNPLFFTNSILRMNFKNICKISDLYFIKKPDTDMILGMIDHFKIEVQDKIQLSKYFKDRMNNAYTIINNSEFDIKQILSKPPVYIKNSISKSSNKELYNFSLELISIYGILRLCLSKFINIHSSELKKILEFSEYKNNIKNLIISYLFIRGYLEFFLFSIDTSDINQLYTDIVDTIKLIKNTGAIINFINYCKNLDIEIRNINIENIFNETKSIITYISSYNEKT